MSIGAVGMDVCACAILNFVITLQCCCEHVHCTVCGLDYNKVLCCPKLLLMSNSKSLVNTIMI